jgi:hypothetical protein
MRATVIVVIVLVAILFYLRGHTCCPICSCPHRNFRRVTLIRQIGTKLGEVLLRCDELSSVSQDSDTFLPALGLVPLDRFELC